VVSSLLASRPLLGAVLVFFLFPKKAEEEQLSVKDVLLW